MSRQNQEVGWKDLPEPLASSNPFSQRVGVGLRGLNAHIRRDFREDLVTRDDDLQFWAIKADVFWSVAVANERPPLSSINFEVLTILNSTVTPAAARCSPQIDRTARDSVSTEPYQSLLDDKSESHPPGRPWARHSP